MIAIKRQVWELRLFSWGRKAPISSSIDEELEQFYENLTTAKNSENTKPFIILDFITNIGADPPFTGNFWTNDVEFSQQRALKRKDIYRDSHKYKNLNKNVKAIRKDQTRMIGETIKNTMIKFFIVVDQMASWSSSKRKRNGRVEVVTKGDKKVKSVEDFYWWVTKIHHESRIGRTGTCYLKLNGSIFATQALRRDTRGI